MPDRTRWALNTWDAAWLRRPTTSACAAALANGGGAPSGVSAASQLFT